jgi:teichoic acid transport system permease protein
MPLPPVHDVEQATAYDQASADYVRSVWARRDFATAVAVGEMRTQNMDTVLGNVWHILNPLLLIGIYYLVFGVILGLSERGGVDNFLAFLAVGVFMFHY